MAKKSGATVEADMVRRNFANEAQDLANIQADEALALAQALAERITIERARTLAKKKQDLTPEEVAHSGRIKGNKTHGQS